MLQFQSWGGVIIQMGIEVAEQSAAACGYSSGYGGFDFCNEGISNRYWICGGSVPHNMVASATVSMGLRALLSSELPSPLAIPAFPPASATSDNDFRGYPLRASWQHDRPFHPQG